MTPWLVGGAVAGASFALQAWPRVLRPLFGVDGWRHLTIARYIRTHRRLPGDGDLPNYLFQEGTDYPPLLRVGLAAWPSRWWQLPHRFLAPLLDACHVLTLFIVAWRLSGDVRLAVAAQLGYALNPLMVMENSQLSPRPLSALLVTWTIGPLVAWSLTGAWGWLLLGECMMALLFLSHRMAVQALLVLSTAFGIMTRSAVWPALILGGIALAWGFSRGFYAKVGAGHWLMLRYWFRNQSHRYAHQVRGFRAEPGRPTDVILTIQRLLAKIPASALIAGFPVIVPAAGFTGLWLTGGARAALLIPERVVPFLMLWMWSLIGWGALVRQMPRLRFLGEGERYGEYAAFPAAILAALGWHWGISSEAGGGWTAALAMLAVGSLISTLWLQWRVIVRGQDRSVTEEHQRLYDVIRRELRAGPVRLATLPLGLADAATFFTGCPVLATDSSLAHWRYYSDFTPVLRRPLAEVLRRFQITHLLVSETFVSREELRLPAAREVAREGSLVLFRLGGNSHEERSRETSQFPYSASAA